MITMYSNDKKDYIEVAKAIQILAYHNMGFLCEELRGNNKTINEEIRYLLGEFLKD